MAWQPNPLIVVTFYIRDDDEAVGRFKCNLPFASMSDAKDWAATMQPLVQGIVGGAVYRYSITHSTYATPIPTAAGNINERGSFFFEDADNPAGVDAIRVPGIKSALLLADGVSIDTTDPDVAALVAATESGIAGTQPCNVDGSDLVALLSAYLEIM